MPNQPAARHWSRLNEVTFTLGIRLLFAAARVLGRRGFRLLLLPVVLFYAATQAQPRRASRDYLRRLAAATGAAPPGAWAVVRHFVAFGESILDRLLAFSGRYPWQQVAVDGLDLVAREVDAGRGAVIVVAHLGNFDICRVMAQRNPKHVLTALVHTQHAVEFNRLLAELNPGGSIRTLQVTALDAAVATELAQRVGAGELLAIAGDRTPVRSSGLVTAVEFLGAPAWFPVGPYILAHALRVKLLALFCLPEGDGYRMRFELLREQVTLPARRTGRRAEALRDLAAQFAARLEEHTRRAPYQWFNFYDFWAVAAPDPDRS
jgi:predicted LPLAT superfamily acyltransferase